MDVLTSIIEHWDAFDTGVVFLIISMFLFVSTEHHYGKAMEHMDGIKSTNLNSYDEAAFDQHLVRLTAEMDAASIRGVICAICVIFGIYLMLAH